MAGNDHERSPMLGDEAGRKSWPAIQPTLPRKAAYFLCGNCCGCCPMYVLIAPVWGVFAYVLGGIGLVLLAVVAFVAYALLACPVWTAQGFLSSWYWNPANWVVDLYTKATFLAYQAVLLSRATPNASAEFMPADQIRPKEQLAKYDIAYALNIKVPKGEGEEFAGDPILPDAITQRLEESLSLLPQFERFDEFEPGEDPVEFVMKQLNSVYPEIYQVWNDKLSDTALTRFALYGLGAHRVESVRENGTLLYVVRTNQLSSLEMRDGIARYGGDAYFDTNWRPVKIVDKGIGPLREDGGGIVQVSRPGESTWEEAKFHFRSSMSVLVTLVDHLYGIHLQTSNIITTALREKLSPNHPIRRFLTPFTYQTISVNDNARNNLVQPRSMGPRCFGFTDKGMALAFASAPSLLMAGLEVKPEDGGPFLDREKYIDYLKNKRSIDTEYFRQSKTFWRIVKKFVQDYISCYYPTPEAFVTDPEMKEFFRQVAYQMEFISPNTFDISGSFNADPSTMYTSMVDVISNFIFTVTAGHEQVGAVEAYMQDVSFCAFKWAPGKLMGSKQTATAQALLMSFTSTPMPKLLGENWTHLFPEPEMFDGSGATQGCAGGKGATASTPVRVFNTFQAELAEFSKYCDAYNEAAPTRNFPDCFPMYVLNPKVLDCSISV